MIGDKYITKLRMKDATVIENSETIHGNGEVNVEQITKIFAI